MKRSNLLNLAPVAIIICASLLIQAINGQIFIKGAGSNISSNKIIRSKNSVNKTLPSDETNKNTKIGFEDGVYFTIASVPSGKVLTVEGANFSRGANVVAEDWNGEDRQIWLALLAPKSHQLSSIFARDANSGSNSRFVLVPKRQSYSNSKSNNDDENKSDLSIPKYTLNNLPSLTEVLTLDSLTGNLTTEVYLRAQSSQLWVPEDAGQGRIYLRNLGNNQCVKNFDYKPGNLFQKISSFINRLRKPYKPKPEPKPLSTLDCSSTDITQKWGPEPV